MIGIETAIGMVVECSTCKDPGKEYIGFIDADNYFPDAVNEYVKIFLMVVVSLAGITSHSSSCYFIC
jgi:hypothetical protein